MKTRRLSVTLSPEELRLRGKQLALKVEEYGRREALNKAAAKENTDALKTLRGSMDELALAVETGRETREVTGGWVRRAPTRGIDTPTMVWVRDDTGEVVDERPATMDDRQEGLPFDDEPEPRH